MTAAETSKYVRFSYVATIWFHSIVMRLQIALSPRMVDRLPHVGEFSLHSRQDHRFQ